jgi:molybdopterin molybdotransferase
LLVGVPLPNPEEAERIIRAHLTPLPGEDCALAEARGRVLRSDLRADRDLPPFDRVTMDGFALRSRALASGVRRFRVEGVQAAGMRAQPMPAAADACLEIMTGAVLPGEADSIVPVEDTTREGAWMVISGAVPAVGNAIHRRGSDHAAGTVIVPAGGRMSGREVAVAAACGYATLNVAQLPRVAVVSTGDELVEVEAAVASHQIRRSNDHALRAALLAAGCTRVERFHLRDVRHEIEHMLWHIIAEFDVVVITGGVSKGKFDFLPVELERQGVRKLFHGVAQRPGKPMWFGLSSRGTPIFALPGNPVSAYTCLHRHVLPALAAMSGLVSRPRLHYRLGRDVAFKPALTWLLPVRLENGADGTVVAMPEPSNTSGDFGGLVGTDGFVALAGPGEWRAGTAVAFWPWV